MRTDAGLRSVASLLLVLAAAPAAAQDGAPAALPAQVETGHQTVRELRDPLREEWRTTLRARDPAVFTELDPFTVPARPVRLPDDQRTRDEQ